MVGLREDVERAGERSAELAEMSDAQRIDRLRAELAKIRKAAEQAIELLCSDCGPQAVTVLDEALNQTIGGMEE